MTAKYTSDLSDFTKEPTKPFFLSMSHETQFCFWPSLDLQIGHVLRGTFNTCVLGPNHEGRTTISSATEQVSDLYSQSFKRSDSVRALTYKRLPTELINFAHGG